MTDPIKLWLSQFLLLSIALSSILVFSGGVLYLMQQGQEIISYQQFSTTASIYTSFEQVLLGLLLFKPMALVFAGFLILVLSQMIRVLVLGIYFYKNREFILAASSFFIFIVLLVSLLWPS